MPAGGAWREANGVARLLRHGVAQPFYHVLCEVRSIGRIDESILSIDRFISIGFRQKALQERAREEDEEDAEDEEDKEDRSWGFALDSRSEDDDTA